MNIRAVVPASRRVQPIAERRRFVFIDALRGVAAISVVLYHALEGRHIPALHAAMPRPLAAIIENGDLGVAIFFVISGFVIAASLDREHIGFPALGRFMLRRSIRLDPPYWVAIGATIAFGALAGLVVKGRPPETYSGAQIVAHLFYAQDLLGYPQISGVFWTLCLEVQFYLVHALMLATGHFSAALFAGAAVSLLWPLGAGPDVIAGLFLPRWHCFLLGVAAHRALFQKIPAHAFVVYALLIAAGSLATGDRFSIASCITAMVIFGVGARDLLHCGWRWLQGLGAISYSLYLMHTPVTGAVFRIGKMLGPHSVLSDAVWWLASVAACIGAAAAVWLLVERPSMRLAKKIGV